MSSDEFWVKGLCGSGMVLQRSSTNCVYGAAPAGSEIQMEFRGRKFSVTADKDGSWKIEFNPGAEGGPERMLLKCGATEICFDDIYIGEVWVSSGQSNAQLPMERMAYTYPDEFAAPADPFVRMITVPISWSFDGEKDSLPDGGISWKCASPENLGNMSGTGYFFAKKLRAELGVPVGIINASQGGSPVVSWMNEDAIKMSGVGEQYLERLEKCRTKEYPQRVLQETHAAQSGWDSSFFASDEGFRHGWDRSDISSLDSSWQDFSLPGELRMDSPAGSVWFKKEIVLSAQEAAEFNAAGGNLWLGSIVDADKVWVNGTECGVTYYCYPPRRYSVPSGILRAGSNTITVRVQYGGGRVKFYSEKPYFLFCGDVRVAPAASRNVEKFDDATGTGVKISLCGTWKMRQGTTAEPRPGEVFFEWEPTALFNSMLAPAFGHCVRGAVWYQGESDAGRYSDYKFLLMSMINLWRNKFRYQAVQDGGKMPFVVIQLPNWSDGRDENLFQMNSEWASMREVQSLVADETDNCALSVMIDAGEWNDLHPEKKFTAGTRAAREALRIAYGKNYPAGAVPEKFSLSQKNITVGFDCGNEMLKAFAVDGKRADFSAESEYVYGFSILTDCGIFGADARISGKNEISVDCSAAAGKILEIRYLWADSPAPVNLYSGEIPVAPFRKRMG